MIPELRQLRPQSKVRGHQEIGPVIVLQAIIIIVVLGLVKTLPNFHLNMRLKNLHSLYSSIKLSPV